MDERMKRVFGATVGREGDRRRLLRLLGLSADDCLTPLTIIGAAHVRLRRVRRLSPACWRPLASLPSASQLPSFRGSSG